MVHKKKIVLLDILTRKKRVNIIIGRLIMKLTYLIKILVWISMVLDYIQKKFVPNHFPHLPNQLLSPHLPFLTRPKKEKKDQTEPHSIQSKWYHSSSYPKINISCQDHVHSWTVQWLWKYRHEYWEANTWRPRSPQTTTTSNKTWKITKHFTLALHFFLTQNTLKWHNMYRRNKFCNVLYTS